MAIPLLFIDETAPSLLGNTSTPESEPTFLKGKQNTGSMAASAIYNLTTLQNQGTRKKARLPLGGC